MQSDHVTDLLEDAKSIASDDRLSDIDKPFRVLAGPGAGKTYWLVKHIRDVIRRSERLGANQRIACISYTRVAAGEIEKGLGSAATHVDVSTIHSFLYRSIVKPYLPWVCDEDGNPLVNYWDVDGHSPHQPIRGIVDHWIKDVSKMPGLWKFENKFSNGDDILSYLSSLRWEWDADTQAWKLADRGYPPDGPFPSKEENLRKYKERCWQAGMIDHDDVLHFAVRILKEIPFLIQFLSARYPYVFVDEFQDTTAAQTEVLRRLSVAGSTVGVIGDLEQSIFEFAGANPEDLLCFEPDGQETYFIVSNRRSTEPVLRLLNHVRRGKSQDHHDDDGAKENWPPVVLVGSPETAREYVSTEVDESVQVLVRNNVLVRQLAGADLPSGSYNNSWEKLRGKNLYRTEWLEAVLEGIREAQEQKRYGEAIRILYRGLRTRNGRLLREVFTKSGDRKLVRDDRRRTAATLLPLLLRDVDRYQKMNGLELYRSIRRRMLEVLPNTPMSEPTTGEYAQLLEGTSYKELYATARLRTGDGRVKTIHKSKGEEYPVVLIHRGSREGESDEVISHLIGSEDPEDPEQQEERRVTYVGLSRAEKRLYICVEQLSEENQAQLEDLGLSVRRLDDLADRR
jgi:DNA helicase-2/ATP-dependent DNA helicase PcrA